MDPLTHTFVGSSLSAAGLRRATPLATAALVLGANAPDVDIVAQAFGPYVGLAWRRGITHGLPALIVLPVALTGLLLAWDSRVRLRRRPDAAPVRPLPLLVLAVIGVWSHPALDWLNAYGMRWWLPFDGSWSYGDAVFIVDPWLWLLLGGATFLAFSQRRASRIGWGVLALLLSVPVLGIDGVPGTAKVLWVAGLIGWIAVRAGVGRTGAANTPVGSRGERVARTAGGIAAAYILLMVAQTQVAERIVLAEAATQGLPPAEDVMVGPVPADPLRSEVILRTPEGYHTGSFHWLGRPRLRLESQLPGFPAGDPLVEAAERHPDARNFLVWSRFPRAAVAPAEDGWTVHFQDVRYPGPGPLGGPTVHVSGDDPDLAPFPEEEP